MKYKIWNGSMESLGGEAKAETFEASTIEEAVKDFGLKEYNLHPFEEIDVYVRCLDGKREGKLYEIELEAEEEINFMTGLAKEVKPS